MSQLTLSDASPPCMPATGAGAVRTSPREAAPDVSEADLAWQNKASFDPGAKQQQEWTSRLPIFRMANMQQYDPVKERSEDELQAMTFLDWLDYFLRLPAFAYKRRALFTDQQYLDVLYQCIPGNHATVSDQMKGRPVKEETWLYGQLSACTYKVLEMSFKVSVDQKDTGPVLVTFKEAGRRQGRVLQPQAIVVENAARHQ